MILGFFSNLNDSMVTRRGQPQTCLMWCRGSASTGTCEMAWGSQGQNVGANQ